MSNQMKELYEYRERLLERVLERAGEFRAAVETVADPKSAREAGGWTAHQLAVHVRDVAVNVYGMRIRRTAAEPNPEFQNFDADEWMAAHYAPDEPLGKVLDEFTAEMNDLVTRLRQSPQELWSRESRHAVYGGGFTVQTWVERGLAHIEEHLQTVRG